MTCDGLPQLSRQLAVYNPGIIRSYVPCECKDTVTGLNNFVNATGAVARLNRRVLNYTVPDKAEKFSVLMGRRYGKIGILVIYFH